MALQSDPAWGGSVAGRAEHGRSWMPAMVCPVVAGDGRICHFLSSASRDAVSISLKSDVVPLYFAKDRHLHRTNDN